MGQSWTAKVKIPNFFEEECQQNGFRRPTTPDTTKQKQQSR